VVWGLLELEEWMIVMVVLDFWTLVSYQSLSFLSLLCSGGAKKIKRP